MSDLRRQLNLGQRPSSPGGSTSTPPLERLPSPPPTKIRQSRPQPTAVIPEDPADGDSSSTSSASSVDSIVTVIPSDSQHRAPSQPLSNWSEFFQQELYLIPSQQPDEDLVTGNTKYHVYITPPANVKKDPLFVCHHGAGSGGLSFAIFAREVRRRLKGAGVLSIEARGHGSHVHSPAVSEEVKRPTEPVIDYSLSTLCDDLETMISLTKAKLCWSELPSMVFVGHSLGGAVVADLASKSAFGAKLVGFAVIDVVEGSAMEALKSMQTLLAGRPQGFRSVEEGVEWHIRSRTIRNPESAKASVPSLLIPSNQNDDSKYAWRTNLAGTRPYWVDWFQGLSKKFLGGKAAKMLILAGTDRLDKELMIGQMQGKFQLQVLLEAGHFVQEDVPDTVAELVAEFWKRNDRGALILPPKVSDLLAQGKKV